jgi:hypothetical protein
MYTRGLLFQCAGTVKIQPIVFVWNKADFIIIIENKYVSRKLKKGRGVIPIVRDCCLTPIQQFFSAS